eukprot:6466020-Prymnesium_polylepis.1
MWYLPQGVGERSRGADRKPLGFEPGGILGDVVDERLAAAGGDLDKHVVGRAARRDVQAVRVQAGRVDAVEIVLDGFHSGRLGSERIVQLHNQALARRRSDGRAGDRAVVGA